MHAKRSKSKGLVKTQSFLIIWQESKRFQQALTRESCYVRMNINRAGGTRTLTLLSATYSEYVLSANFQHRPKRAGHDLHYE